MYHIEKKSSAPLMPDFLPQEIQKVFQYDIGVDDSYTV
jgi:hypothetical protein